MRGVRQSPPTTTRSRERSRPSSAARDAASDERASLELAVARAEGALAVLPEDEALPVDPADPVLDALPEELDADSRRRASVNRVIAKGGMAQAKAIKFGLDNGGVVERSDVYALAGWDQEKRSLRGFTRPVDNAVAEMVAAGQLRDDVEIPQVLKPHYEGPGKAKWFTVPRELVLLQRRSRNSAA